MDVITIAPISRRNRLTLSLLSGGLALIFLIALSKGLSLIWLLPLALLTVFTTVLAIGKRIEPAITLRLDSQGLNYHHRRGHYEVDWEQMLRIDQPRVPEHPGQPLDYVGIRLRDPARFYQAIAPRLALSLLREQRPLTRLAQPECNSGQCADLLPDETALPESGLTGIRAAYATHQMMLRQQLGYDLYLHHSCLDRSPQEFIVLVRDYQMRQLGPSAGSTTATTE
ncbi:DUF2982 domain-containing protein [Ferrimonas balearica]|uniref:DUF2982 domain-containing protein n=1 Tax=Ferrimonas balearica TaxID=44012 RepID=UPI001C995D83|nr:DUF2982 domain-containing protein [Ferrimonas balearica]MBY5921214.1 DUF2982 domain-containing protein [Ferrimonas balearica]MBY5996101.1 DUF2982 domain-containing protein [Ferrimonas balearica]